MARGGVAAVDSNGSRRIASSTSGTKAGRVGNLYAIVQAHIDEYGVREAELARRIGTSPQTVNSWKKRGVRALPSEKLLRNLSTLTKVPYPVVLEAALVDAGYMDKPDEPPAESPGASETA